VEDPGTIFQNFLQQATSNQFDTLMGLSSSAAVEDSIIIPCEFCGVQLEEEVLFYHQVRIPGVLSTLQLHSVRRALLSSWHHS
jgi:hypothetical protein